MFLICNGHVQEKKMKKEEIFFFFLQKEYVVAVLVVVRVPLSYTFTGYTQKNGAVSKLKKKFISPLTRAQRTRQQRQLSKFLMRYHQFASHAYGGAAWPVSKMASRQEKVFCVLRFEMSRSVVTIQREFPARFRKTHQAISANYFKNKILKKETESKCRLCEEHEETIDHLTSGCPIFAKNNI
jgi:hypothetical protein